MGLRLPIQLPVPPRTTVIRIMSMGTNTLCDGLVPRAHGPVIIEVAMNSEAFEYMTSILGPRWVEDALNEYEIFRDQFSPPDRWYHRLPTVSPIVPLLYWNSRAEIGEDTIPLKLDQPMGFWGGDPTEILKRLAEEIQHFEKFWRALPDNRGTKNLVWALESPQRFFSLAHELATAFFFGARPGVEVEPFFLDPRAEKGKPDIVAHTSDRSFAIQCKSQDPTAARQLPYDLWQYIAGVFHRLVADSGRSIHFSMGLDGDLGAKQVRQLVKKIARLIPAGLVTPYPWRSKYGEFQLVNLEEVTTSTALLRLRRSTYLHRHPLYDELVRIPSLLHDESRCASFCVGGHRGDDVTAVISKAVTAATASARTSDPLIVAVHLYHEIDFREFPERPMVKEHLIPWSEKFFAVHPELAMIYLSSNYEVYNFREVGDQIGVRHARAGWVMESPDWDHTDVAALGI